MSRSYELTIRLDDAERDLVKLAEGIKGGTLAAFSRSVLVREARGVVENYEADLRIAAQRERQQQEYMDGVGRTWARNRGYA